MGSVLMLPQILTLIIYTVIASASIEKQLYLSESGSATATIHSIPGGSTFRLCPASTPDTDLFTVERVYWDPVPPRISEQQKLFIYGVFSSSVPWDAPATLDVHIPEWHHPYEPAHNYTGTEDFCGVCRYMYQADDERGVHKVCDGEKEGVEEGPNAGPAVLVFEDFLFWPLPGGEWYAKLDVMMPDQEDGVLGSLERDRLLAAVYLATALTLVYVCFIT